MNSITIVGVGWDRGQLTLDAINALKRSKIILLHTDRCGCAGWLMENGLAYESLDDLYERYDDFDEHAEAAAQAVLDAAARGSVAYAVFDVRDLSAGRLIDRLAGAVRVIPGPPLEGALLAYAKGETRLAAAADWESLHLAARENCLIRELDSRELACEVKLRLMEVYPEDSAVWLMTGGEAPVSIPLYTLDRRDDFDHKTCVLVPARTELTELERFDFEHLNEIMRRLCAPDGCPWDRVQTHQSLRTCLLEEAYEVIDAIDEADPNHLYDELGDLLMQVAIHTEIARRHGEFDMMDVTSAICEKLISRHTHIFGNDCALDAEQVLHLWDKNKMAERHQNTRTETLASVTPTLPATLRAVKVLKRSADAGLSDKDVESVCDRCRRLLAAPWTGEDVEARLGELLLAVAGLARLVHVDPEIALNGAVKRFIDRFATVEREITTRHGGFEDLDTKTLREYWNSVKL